jgi:uncharacterized flavoprotein (TIGR03862 family)
MSNVDHQSPSVAIIGAGPAGLMAAEVLSQAGVRVDIYDAMPSVGRKFLLAGKGGLNITHAEAFTDFVARYGGQRARIEPLLENFGPAALRDWVHDLGIDTFVGSSGRVFPREMKAAPLLRAWLHRLRATGVRLHVRHRWLGWNSEGALRFDTPRGHIQVQPAATLLALGGGSWARLGSDAAWVPLLEARGVEIAPLQPANCGFDVDWSDYLRSRCAGQPVKSVAISHIDVAGRLQQQLGEFVLTETGLEGSLIYALSAMLRDSIAATGSALIHLDLAPGRDLQRLKQDLSRPRGSQSLANFLRTRAGIEGVKAVLLREQTAAEVFSEPDELAAAIKAVPIKLVAPRPLDEAISTAGGVRFEALDERFMLRALPGVFCAGEMLDWEAPTGGYLLTACFAMGRATGAGMTQWLASAV